MDAFRLSLVPPALYSVTNLIDKNLLSKYFKEGGAGTLILVSTLLAGVASLVFLWIEPTVLHTPFKEVFVLSLTAVLDVALLWLYLAALEREEPSVVIAYYQLVPVIGLVFGFIILNEMVSHEKLIAAGVILVGTTIISFRFDGARLKFRRRTTILMVGACTCWAVGNVLFKYVALEENVWRSLFWKHVAFGVIGIVLFVSVQTYRKSFVSALRANSLPILLLNLGNEIIYVVGSVVSSVAQMYTQVALVQLANTYQHFFVLGIGVAVTAVSSHRYLGAYTKDIIVDTITQRHLIQSMLALIIAGWGTYLLVTSH